MFVSKQGLHCSFGIDSRGRMDWVVGPVQLVVFLDGHPAEVQVLNPPHTSPEAVVLDV